MKLVLAFVAVLTALAAGCGGATGDNGSRSAPDLARIACDEAGVGVLTARVQARLDGLHVELANGTGGEAHVTLERSPSNAVGVGGSPGTSAHVLTIGPGTWTATCYGEGGSLRTAALEVVDTGIWVSTELTGCETPQATHGDPPQRIRAEEGELAELARLALDELVDLEPGFVLERAGYPEQAEAVFRARSDDRTVVTMSFYPDGPGSWVVGEATECGDVEPNPEPGDG